MLDSRLFFLLWAGEVGGIGEARPLPLRDGTGLGLGTRRGMLRLAVCGCWSVVVERASECDVPTDVVELLAWEWVKMAEGGVALRNVDSKGLGAKVLRPLGSRGCCWLWYPPGVWSAPEMERGWKPGIAV